MKPLLFVDVDGVLSLFSSPHEPPPLRPDTHFHYEQGIGHLIALDNCRRLVELQDLYELVWATGWEEKANGDLYRLAGLPAPLPVVRFDRGKGKYDHQAHWKLGAIEEHAGSRPMAWIDDAHDDACREWAAARPAPTLLVEVDPRNGLDEIARDQLAGWPPTLQVSA